MSPPIQALITGIGGFVGPHLAAHLLAHGYQVTGLLHEGVDRDPPPALDHPQFRSVRLIPFHLAHPQSIQDALDLAQPQALFHLAGYSSVRGSFSQPAETFQANCRGLENLLEALRIVRPDCRFIFAGSADEYGLQIVSEEHYRWALETFRSVFPPPARIPELPIDELNPLRPLSPYAVSKVYGDYLCRTYWNAYNLPCLVARLFNHEGPGRGEGFVTSSIIRQCQQLARREIDCIRIGNVCAFRDWSHVADIVQGYRALAENGAPGEAYVLGSSRMNSVLTYLLISLREVGYEVQSLATLDGARRVDAPLEPDPAPFLGLKFDKPRIDGLLLSGELSYDLSDRGLTIRTDQGDLTVIFDPALYRPADVPLQISNPERAQRIGFKITRSLREIIIDQLGHT
ncbi:MAG: GDP-mannose 4,6-dehydratase [Anaerolineae bacterium]|jgi:GDPmannose 4,6-dehydratase|nr:GDP-mannose 4,6-dehydratase [Anaerolineae bacterium]MCZ7551946.1 GDP-mannose 4,6-dehydratase [Anaerolineales bacterium]